MNKRTKARNETTGLFIDAGRKKIQFVETLRGYVSTTIMKLIGHGLHA